MGCVCLVTRMALVTALPTTDVAAYATDYEKVYSKIYKIAPRLRESSIEYEAVTGICLDSLMEYIDDYVNQVQTHIGVAQDELMAHLKEKIQQAQRQLKYSDGF